MSGPQGMTAAEHSGLVIAARDGDDRALGELLAAHLPVVYNIVRRALSRIGGAGTPVSTGACAG